MITKLEKAALLVKAGFAASLIEAAEQDVEEVAGPYDPAEWPPEWDNTDWYGGPNSGGREGYYGTNDVCRVTLSNRGFVVIRQEVFYTNTSMFTSNVERDYPDGDNPECGTHYYVIRSEGEELDTARVNSIKLVEILLSASRHLPEALEMLETEYLSRTKKK